MKPNVPNQAKPVMYLEMLVDSDFPYLVVELLPEALATRARAEMTWREGPVVDQTTSHSVAAGVDIENAGRFSKEQVDAMLCIHRMQRSVDEGMEFCKWINGAVRSTLDGEEDGTRLDERLLLLKASVVVVLSGFSFCYSKLQPKRTTSADAVLPRHLPLPPMRFAP